MGYDRHCTGLVAQTDLLRAEINGDDMTAPVPSCPGCSLG